MIIAKAIELLNLNALEKGSYLPPDYITALKLGIEALKRIQYVRLHPYKPVYKPLPGESMPERGIR